MGARPSSFKTGGGGFLNNVDGEITDYEFTTEIPGGGKGKKKKSNDEFQALYFKITVMADGAEDAVQTSLYTGLNALEIEISDEGKTITREDGEDISFPNNKPFGLFLNSIVANGFDEDAFPENGEPVNMEPLIGQRMTFVQQVDVEATDKVGKRKGKDGKDYNRQNLVVSELLGAAEEKPKANGKGKPAVTAKSSGKVTAKAKSKDVEEDYTAEATTTLIAILAGNDGEINRNKLGTPALRILLKSKSANKDAVLNVLKSEDFLATEDGWTFDKKSGTISAEK